MDRASGMTPVSDRAPWVGFSPITPQKDAGIRIDPPVSVPRARGTTPAATAAPDPPLDPPVIRARSQGLAVGPQAEMRLVAPAASSCWLVLPTRMAPASRMRTTTAASRVASLPSHAREHPVVSLPETSKSSLAANGTPPSGPGSSPAATRASTCLASSAAAPKYSCVKALVDSCHC